MAGQSGYYSWVCFIDAQRGGWFGPITQDLIDDYEQGYALDDNIKSWTEFTFYNSRPLTTLTCNFSKRINARNGSPKTATFADCNPSGGGGGGNNPTLAGAGNEGLTRAAAAARGTDYYRAHCLVDNYIGNWGNLYYGLYDAQGHDQDVHGGIETCRIDHKIE